MRSFDKVFVRWKLFGGRGIDDRIAPMLDPNMNLPLGTIRLVLKAGKFPCGTRGFGWNMIVEKCYACVAFPRPKESFLTSVWQWSKAIHCEPQNGMQQGDLQKHDCF